MTETFRGPASSPEVKIFKGRLLPQLPELYREPCSDNPLITPAGAVPANPFLDDDVKGQQNEMRYQFDILYRTPPQEHPEPFIDMILDDYIINDERRKMINYEKYMQWSPHMKILTAEDRMLVDLFERGRASPAQILEVAKRTPRMKDVNKKKRISFEFAKVTHPYGYRMEHLIPLRAEMNKAIEAHDGVVIPDVEPYRDIKILPHVMYVRENGEMLQRLKGFIVKYKRDYGFVHMPNGKETLRLVERQIAAFRVDEDSGFDQSIIQAMNTLADTYPGRIRWDHHYNPHLNNRLARVGATEFIETAVQADSLEKFVVPISTTLYGFKEKRDVPQKMARKLIEVGGRLAYFPAVETVEE